MSALALPETLVKPAARISSRVPLIVRAWWVVMLCNALDAYSVGPVPVAWLGQLASIAVACYLILSEPIHLPPGGMLWPLLMVWGIALSVSQGFLEDYASMMPPLATTSYPVFITLRMLSLLSTTATIVIGCFLLQNGQREFIIRQSIQLGAAVALYSIYVYVAHRFGWPEVPRTRVGTFGAGQATHFTYAFHRALGSFREPSLLACWLTTPLLLCFENPRKTIWIPALLMMMAVLLTGSLSGIMGLLLGMVAGFVLLYPHGIVPLRLLFGGGAIVGLAGMAFSALAVANDNGSTQLTTVLWERVEEMLDEGASGSNRAYIYQALESSPVPWVGAGFGNSNLIFSRDYNSDVVVSFLSLYLSVQYSIGWPGFTVLLLALLSPILLARHWAGRGTTDQRRTAWVLTTAYVAWLAYYLVLFEETQTMFAVTYLLVAIAPPRQLMSTPQPLRRTAPPRPLRMATLERSQP
jgi:hypothetical protein